jgi:hypothetical protein
MFDFDITPDTTKATKKTKKITKKTSTVTPHVHTILDDLIEANDLIIEKKKEQIHDLEIENTALKTKTDMVTLLKIRRILHKATILKKPNEEKSAKLIEKIKEFDSVLNIAKSDLDPYDMFYFNT